MELGPHENRHGVVEPLHHGRRAVDIDIEHDPLAGLDRGADLAPQRAVPISAPKNLETLQKRPCSRQVSNSSRLTK